MGPATETRQAFGNVTCMLFKFRALCLGGIERGHEGMKEEISHYLIATCGALIYYAPRMVVSSVPIMPS